MHIKKIKDFSSGDHRNKAMKHRISVRLLVVMAIL